MHSLHWAALPGRVSPPSSLFLWFLREQTPDLLPTSLAVPSVSLSPSEPFYSFLGHSHDQCHSLGDFDFDYHQLLRSLHLCLQPSLLPKLQCLVSSLRNTPYFMVPWPCPVFWCPRAFAHAVPSAGNAFPLIYFVPEAFPPPPSLP